jgi:proline iminopeptidase
MSEHGNAGIPGERGVIRAGNFELGYAIEGDGKPALVIGSAVYYPRTFSDRLRQELKLVFLDHGGHGRPSGAFEPSDYGLGTVLADVEAARRQLGLDEVVVIGHSGNGYLALEYAKAYPQRVSHVVMIATGPSLGPAHMRLAERYWEEAVCPERKAKLESDLRQLPADIQAAPERRFAAFCIRMGARSWYDHDYDATALWDGVGVNMPVVDHMWGTLFRDVDVAAGLDELDVPVFLALGRFDYLVPPYAAWDPYRDRFRDLTVRVFDRSGHTPQLEESGAFDDELLRWLAGRPAR